MQPSNYSHLRSLTDDAFDAIDKRHPKQITCRIGCHSCCTQGLTVGNQERIEIAKFLVESPERLAKAEEIRSTNPHRGERCSFLEGNGKCSIYAVRPITCRSHGAPLAIAKDGYFQIDVCAFNFNDTPIESLPPDDFFILDDLHGWVGFFNATNQRFALTLGGILGIDK